MNKDYQNNNNEKEREAAAVPASANELHKMSPLDVVELLLKGKMQLTLRMEMRIDCTEILKERGYSNLEIARLLGVDKRTVCNYLDSLRKRNGIIAGTDFQKKHMGEVRNNLRTQYARLIRESHSDDASTGDRIRAIAAACQILVYYNQLLERLGYLSVAITEAEMKQFVFRAQEENKTVGGLLGQHVEDWEKLSSEDQASVINYKLYMDDKVDQEIAKLINRTLKSNSYLFQENEFKGEFSPDNLKVDIISRGIYVPVASTSCESLNELLKGGNLFGYFPQVRMSDEVLFLKRSFPSLTVNDRIKFNRLILEAAFPGQCPKKRIELKAPRGMPNRQGRKKTSRDEDANNKFKKEIFQRVMESVFQTRIQVGLFTADEFKGQYSADDLLSAIKQDGIPVPEAETSLIALNSLMAYERFLFKYFPNIVFSGEVEYFINNTPNNSNRSEDLFLIYYNRLILEDVYPTKCPKKSDRPMEKTSLEDFE